MNDVTKRPHPRDTVLTKPPVCVCLGARSLARRAEPKKMSGKVADMINRSEGSSTAVRPEMPAWPSNESLQTGGIKPYEMRDVQKFWWDSFNIFAWKLFQKGF